MDLTIVNSSGLQQTIYWMVWGYDPATNACSYVNQSGRLIACRIGDDCATYQYPLGASAAIPNFPSMVSARLVMSVGDKLKIAIMKDGAGNPNVQDVAFFNPTDPSYNIVFDKVEFTYTNNKMWVNSTGVDFFGIPNVIKIEDIDGNSLATSPLAVSRADVFAKFLATTTFSDLALLNGTTDLRVLAPGYSPSFPNDYFDQYVDFCWDKYKNNKITLSLAGAPDGFTSAVGKVNVSGGVFCFVDNLGNKYLIPKPTSAQVFLCNGVFNIDGTLPPKQQQVDGIIKRQIGAALNRSVLGYQDVGSFCANGYFYDQHIANHYSRILHECYTGGQAYGFSYDDVCNEYSSSISLANAASMTVTITKW